MHVNASFLATALAAATLASAAAIAGDSPVRTDYERIANEGTIGDKWMLVPGTTLPASVYPAHLAATGGTACIALGYLIGRDGKPSEFAVLKQWSSLGDTEPVDGYWSAFAQAGADAVSQWRFQPRPGATPVPTYTVATLGFASGKGEDGSVAGQHCRIPQLRDHLAQMQAEYQRSNNIIRQHLEHERRRQTEMRMDEAVRRVNARPKGG